MHRAVKWIGVAAVVATCVTTAGAASVSCQSTPTAIPVRTLQQSQKMDVVCMTVNDGNGNLVPVTPTVQEQCAPVPTGVTGANLPNHLFAVVTQTTRGELAVVDLTAGSVVDIDHSTPGINFVPVGREPTDVAVAPDGQLTFVSCAEVNKPAIYVIPNDRLVGDSLGGTLPDATYDPGFEAGLPLRLTDLPVCALPQPPDAIAIAPLSNGGTGAGDGGSADGGTADAGVAAPGYNVVVMLRAAGGQPAKIVTIDPTGIPGAPPLSPCPIVSAIELAADVPPTWTVGPAWPDGVTYVDGGAGDLRPTEPSPGPSCSWVLPDGGVTEGGTGGVEGGSFQAVAGPLNTPKPSAMALRDDVNVLYVADASLPLIHVIDLRTPNAPVELAPLLGTSVLEPARRVIIAGLAISQVTRDYKRYLYAIDGTDGSLIVYDITDPVASPRTPLVKPHPELTPLLPPDRISFAQPVAAVAFVKHDWPYNPPMSDNAYTGLLCNPNPNAHPDPNTFNDHGAYYRADQVTTINSNATVEQMTTRLRGVFGFVTLSNGSIVPIDVDDWDAPCRRPDPMADGGITGVLDIPEQAPSGPGDLDPYHAPITYSSAIPESAATTIEAFFPVIAPHRARSEFLLRSDPVTGPHLPNLQGPVQLFDVNGAPVATGGMGGQAHPLIGATPLPGGFIDPTYLTNPTDPNPDNRSPNSPLYSQDLTMSMPAVLLPPMAAPTVRVSFDDPQAQIDQNWTVTYEGVLPTVNGVSVTISSNQGPCSSDMDCYNGLRLDAPNAGLCSDGIEDQRIGAQRATQVLAEMQRLKLAQPRDLAKWTGDYVEFNDDILPQGDPWYGDQNNQPVAGTDCWDPSYKTNQDRFNACQQAFDLQSDADQHLARDFPILEAHDSYLLVGRFGWPVTDDNTNPVAEATTNRVIVGEDPSNQPFLKLAACCFHKQSTIKVRTGGEWVAVGTNNLPFLHHVVDDGTSGPKGHNCVLSCDPRQTLLESRSFDVPWWQDDKASPPTCNAAGGAVGAFDRNSPIAMRNPMFSYVTWTGCSTTAPMVTCGHQQPAQSCDHTLTQRDYQWRFAMKGGYTPVTTSLTGQTTTAVSPQSMRFISSLGQLAVIDGESQGLVLIDLNTIQFAQSPFF